MKARVKAGVKAGVRRTGRKATRLDKVRWLIVYSSDIIILLAGFGFLDLYLRRQAGYPAVLAGGAAVALAVFMALSTRPFRIAVRGGPRPTAILTVTGVITLGLAVLFVVWTIPVWLGSLTPFVRRRTALLLSAGALAAVTAYAASLQTAQVLPLLLVLGLLTALCVLGKIANLWLWRVAREAHEGQEARSRLAVSEERLRFARDLNDLLGQSLAGISDGAAAAERVLPSDPQEAARVMFEVRDQARRSLREVRATVQNYRALNLDEVLASVRAVLEAADVRCSVRAETSSLTPESRTLLAAAVREGATNVLKHSKAEQCTITIEDGVLEMCNDGVSAPVGAPAPNGLAGLEQRLRGAGGTLESGPAPGGRYLLRAAVPA
ncbi:sensor histidine kinase [Nonomuraea pusilla]|uniref:Two-component system, NarL family, sensor histidine kinase DesK n=1 Tax=Nonomuraea pusilla TaxID=46177 RepID=A0A1H7LRA1_9ACTN|nr:histidine kinase [Nonomuraea pusilla]SEL01419.1 two-component system, NarL family, sensor histidine kinase DesK [Nonomuraea pusilla]